MMRRPRAPWYRRSRLLGALLISSLAMLSVPVRAQNADRYSEDAVKAVFLYRFTGFIDWPPSAQPGSEFRIAILGSDGVADALNRLLAGRLIKDKPAHVYRIKRAQDLGNADMVYVGSERTEDLAAVTTLVAQRPVLIVSSQNGALEHGSAVNFLLVEQHVRFEVSLAAASRAGLRISSDLLSVATRVLAGSASVIDLPTGNRLAREAMAYVHALFI
jgi:hypothetical protein